MYKDNENKGELMKKLKKKYLLTLLIMILAIGVYIIKDDGSSSKSIKVDKELRLEEGEYYGEKGCDNIFSALNIRSTEKDTKQGEQPTSYELTCDPDVEAIKIITGDENGSVDFAVTTNNFKGEETFSCKKGGSSQVYNVVNVGQPAEFTIVPKNTFQIPKAKDSEEKYTCMKIPDKEYGYINIKIQESLGGLPDSNAYLSEPIAMPLQLENAKVSYDQMTKSGENPDKPVEQNNPLISKDYVQRNKYLHDDSTYYNDGLSTSKTFNTYFDMYNHADPKKKYSATSVDGNLNDASGLRVTGVKRGDGTVISGNINLVCNYDLSGGTIKKILAYNMRDTVDKDDPSHLSYYYYDKDNTNYFYASKTQKIEYNYNWHINVGSNDKSTTPRGKAGCTRKCEEVVKVDYGPPVAVKAGMCFEYRVKVSSIVNCKLEGGMQNDDVNKMAPGVCNPVPYCWSNVYQKVYKIAGPTEEYDSCVKDCDGGKYTEKCSNKCYEEVYGKEDKKIDSTNKSINPSFINSYQGSKCVDGMYYRYGNNQINWCVFNFQMDGLIVDAPGDASWYSSNALMARAAIFYHKNNYSWKAHSTKYQVSSPTYLGNAAGIIRGRYNQDKNKKTLEECHDSCHWETNGCAGNYIYFDYYYYQNQCNSGVVGGNCKKETVCKTYKELTGISLKDSNGNERRICTSDELRRAEAENNLKVQKIALDQCMAATTCNRTESEYRIQYNVALKDKPTVTQVNPYSSAKQYDNTLQNGREGNKEIKNTNLLSYGGCYANKGTNNRWYQSEWTVPGTWISMKGHKISYEDHTGDNSWVRHRGKICIPSNVKETNGSWALEFYRLTEIVDPNSILPANGQGAFSNLNTKFDLTKKYTNNATSTNSKEYPLKNIYDNSSDNYNGYNIFANSSNFGHFKWNFTISCFWAYTKNNPPINEKCRPACTTENGETCGECKCEKDINGKEQCPGSTKGENTEYTIRSFDTDDVLLTGTSNLNIQPKILDATKLRNNIPFNWAPIAQMKYMTKGGYNTDPYNDVLLKYIQKKDQFTDDNLEYQITLSQEQQINIRKYNSEHNKTGSGYEFTGSFKAPPYDKDGTGVVYYVSEFLDNENYLTVKEHANYHLGCNNRNCAKY